MKKDHSVLNCYNRHNTTQFLATNNRHTSTSPNPSANLVALNHLTLRYSDFEATNHDTHVSANIENLNNLEGNPTISTTNDTPLIISSFGHSSFNLHNKLLHLNNILLVLNAIKNLLLAEKFAMTISC